MMTVALGPVLSRAEDPQATGGARARASVAVGTLRAP
jgi:hypothetical protein